MQHKEEGRKPAGGALHQGRAGASFFMGLSSSRRQGGRGTPYEGRGGVCRERRSGTNMSVPPANTKIKFTHPPMQGLAEKTDRFPRTKTI